MRKSLSSPAAVAALLIGFVVLAAPFLAAQTAKIDIPYQKFTLDNGLTLIVHEDHKAPIVAFNVWYHVGSKNEIAGKTGFAHLFEHLMFNGSENFDDDYFKPMQKVGATDLNGTTNEDRTNYFENVPVSALDLVLWMESDRMGHLKGAISQAKLDEQRGVVQNELRQYANEPYSVTEDLILKGTYPPEHPYSWSVGGSIEDLNNAKLEDVQKWFCHVLRSEQRRRRRRRRHRRQNGVGEGQEVLRRHPALSARRPAFRLGGQADRLAPPERPGPRLPSPDLQGLERPRLGHRVRRQARPRQLHPGRRQDLAPLQAPRLRRSAGDLRQRLPSIRARSPASSRSRPTPGPASSSPRSRKPSTKSWPVSSKKARRQPRSSGSRPSSPPVSSGASSGSAASAASPTSWLRARSTAARPTPTRRRWGTSTPRRPRASRRAPTTGSPTASTSSK